MITHNRRIASAAYRLGLAIRPRLPEEWVKVLGALRVFIRGREWAARHGLRSRMLKRRSRAS